MKQELDWGIRITRTDNGYIAEWETLLDDDVVRINRAVFEDKNDDPLDATEEVCEFLIDFFGQGGGRHDKERLHVTRIPGDKHEDTKEEVKSDE